jgi:hypothetical protein
VYPAPIEHSAYFDLTSLQESDEDELAYEYEYDFRSDCEERALSDRTAVSLGTNLSTSRRPAIVLVLDFFLGVVIRSRAHCTKHIWRFIAGSGTTWGLRPGGTPEYHRAINPQDIVLQSRYRLLCDSTHERPISLLNFTQQQRLAISAMGQAYFDRPSGMRSNSKHQYRR